MIFRQILHDDLGCASYLVGDEKAGVAAVVDPRFEIDVYLELAHYIGVTIEHIFETHNHADHVSGHGRLADATGAPIRIHRRAEPDYPHVAFEDGEEFEVGAVHVRALHTPGHRPEHTSYALIDSARAPEPWAVLTGDLLFVGDIARPDLAVEKTEGAKGIFHSLHDTLLALPDRVEVWPGHLGGSMCGGPGMDMKVSSTVGFERAHNPVLAVTVEEEFVEQALAELGPQPPNFESIVGLNTGPLVIEGGTLPALVPRQLEQRQPEGALLVDVRTDEQFDDAHIPGAVVNPILQAGFGTRLSWVAGTDRPVVFVGRDDQDGLEAGRLASAAGVRHLSGFLHGGMTNWRQEGRPVARTERLTVAELADRAEVDPDLQVLDVREQAEWDAGHIPGSRLAVWHDIAGLPEGIDPERPVAAICASGQRAAVAASLLAHFGAKQAIHVVGGGVGAWEKLGRELES
jgi:glyoxylase-like metal-dependent hydrolase (beta-lactamase superfamily II)/rhodanese-related sulfurtransferase